MKTSKNSFGWLSLALMLITLPGWGADASLSATTASPFSPTTSQLNALTFKVDSPAATFSPGNWSGDNGRGGSEYRQTWCTGAYMYWNWETPANAPKATLLLDDNMFSANFQRPVIAYSIDGIWKSNVAVTNEIDIPELKNPGTHELIVVLTLSAQLERWGAPGQSAANVLRVRGLRVDDGAKPVKKKSSTSWAMIFGDSITEGSGTGAFTQYSWLIGQALASAGWDFSLSACGWSGWLAPGDNTHDVPGFYVITNSQNGSGGTYQNDLSRWNKIDGNNHSLLDINGHISGWGEVNQEPSLILINYGTNDKGWFQLKANSSDFEASIRQCLAVLRLAAPRAKIVIIIPFGQFGARDLKAAVQERLEKGDNNISFIDLGPGIARALDSPSKPFGDLHPNAAGHAWCASLIIPRLFTILDLNLK